MGVCVLEREREREREREKETVKRAPTKLLLGSGPSDVCRGNHLFGVRRDSRIIILKGKLNYLPAGSW